MGRVGCMPCINCRKDELREIALRFPETIERIERWGVDGRQALANQLAYLLPFMEEDKLDLLAIDSPQLRLEEIQRLLERIQGELFA
jgi:Lon protease-like protein